MQGSANVPDKFSGIDRREEKEVGEGRGREGSARSCF